MLKKICFSCQINLTIGERPNKKNIESLVVVLKWVSLAPDICQPLLLQLNLTQKANLLRLYREM